MKAILLTLPLFFVLGCYARYDGVTDEACPTDPADPLYDTPLGRKCRAKLDGGADAADGEAPGAAPGGNT